MKESRTAIVVSVCSLLVSFCALLISCQAEFDPLGYKEGQLEEPVPPPPLPSSEPFQDTSEIKFKPNGNNLYTMLSVPNSGVYELTIQRVDFQADYLPIQTPGRPNAPGAAEPLFVTFTNFNPVTGFATFTPKLSHPVPGKQEVPIGVVIVDRNLAGSTYVGTLTMHYTNNGKLDISGVAIDVLDAAPE